ncbi:NAD-dependent epimerase/dehydratase family protein [Halobium salinum]|uniref:NAD-dependent epimerase/dehydratase family protein n=1 Tax=Halobium salinum TaxID=1364940 RepID=A0ABD5PDK8_9EURY|nr:NAD-dependent epimerase/dehydratase family protein [Halobium salinum]
MEYFVTGATGLVGTHVVGELLDAGHEVVALTRFRSNADHLPDAVRVVEGDIAEKEQMREAMRGVDGVFHIAAWFYVGPGPKNVDTAERINVEGTRNVLELMDELDVPKGVYTSTVGVFPGTSGARLDETVTPDEPTAAVYFRTKWQAHYEVARPMMDEGLPLVVVMPGAVYGPGDKLYGSARSAFRSYLTGDLPMVPKRFTIPFDFVGDIARAHVLAMEVGTPGEEYIVASEPRTLPEVFDCAERITGIRAPRPVPDAVFGALANAMRVVERVVTPPEGYESEMLEFFAGKQFQVDNAKAKRELGLEHRPLEDGLREYLAWEQAQLETESEQRRARRAVQ